MSRICWLCSIQMLEKFAEINISLLRRVETWDEIRRALSYGIVLERMKLKTNARAPTNDPIIERASTLVPGYHSFWKWVVVTIFSGAPAARRIAERSTIALKLKKPAWTMQFIRLGQNGWRMVRGPVRPPSYDRAQHGDHTPLTGRPS